jgi:hypothetical protein
MKAGNSVMRSFCPISLPTVSQSWIEMEKVKVRRRKGQGEEENGRGGKGGMLRYLCRDPEEESDGPEDVSKNI